MHNIGERVSDGLTLFSGSWRFVGLHAVWWGLWIGLGASLSIPEPFPFGLLTMVLSLEAILLSTVILMSQNRAAERDHTALALDRERHKRIELIAEHIESLETAQFKILHHIETLRGASQ